MKQWKTIITTTLACATFILPVSGESIETIAGTMPLPTGLHAVSVSNTETVAVGKEIINYELKKVRTEEPVLKSAKTIRDLIKSQEGLNLLGTVVDAYELYGTSQYGEQTSWMVAIDLRTTGNMLGINNNYFLTIDWDGDVVLGSATEQYMIKQVNVFLPKMADQFNKSKGSNIAAHPIKKGETIQIRDVRNLTVENIEYMRKLNNSKYPTYTAGARVMLTQYGVQYPMYVKAALVMNPKTPTLYMFGTEDIEHQYFGVKFDSMIGQLK